jgi:hypothetical protein
VRSTKQPENPLKSDVPNTDDKKIQSVKEIHEDEVIHNDSAKRSASKKRVLSLGNQNARTLGHYSEFITTDEDALRYFSASIRTTMPPIFINNKIASFNIHCGSLL